MREEKIKLLTDKLISDLKKAGIDPDPYDIAIRLTAETLYERELAYNEYIEKGSKQTTEKGRSEATAVRLTAWNSQVRACLGMLKLTPCRTVLSDDQGGDPE